jgi:prepilin-type processing-associated H-X9-DG protein
MPGRYKPVTWAVMLLSHLDEQPLFDEWSNPRVQYIANPANPPNQQRELFNPELLPQIDLFICPSAGKRIPWTDAPNYEAVTNYVANAGFLPTVVGGGNTYFLNNANYLNRGGSERPANGVFLNRLVVDSAGNPRYKVTSTDLKDGQSNTLLFSENLHADNWNTIGKVFRPNEAASVTNVAWGNAALPIADPVSPAAVFCWFYASEPDMMANIEPHVFAPSAPPIPPLPLAPSGFNPDDPNQLDNYKWGSVLKINEYKDDSPESPSGMNWPPERAIGDAKFAPPEQYVRPSSNHSGHVNVAYADGHTDSLSDETDYHVIQALMTPNGAKSDMPVRSYMLKDSDVN